MSCVMTRAEAARLYSTLDETIGVFREEDMSEKAIEFYEMKKEEFIDLFSTEIPESYWFQGTVCLSASLNFDSLEGFHVVCSTGEAGAQKLVDEVVNPALKDAEFEVASSAELGVYGTV
jgi:hypothetical protein